MFENNSINVFPNPATNNFQVKWDNSKGFNIQLFNIWGDNILNIDNVHSDQMINCQYLSNGIYLLKIITPEATFLKKIFISNI
jgi:hypothetical protein